MGMETLGNTGIVAGGSAGVTPTFELGHQNCGYGNYGDGFGQGGSLWAILLLALLGRRGFGADDCGNGYGGAATAALPVITNENFNQRFGSLQDTVNWNGLINTMATQHNAQLGAVAAAKDDICANREIMLTGFGNTRTELANGFGATMLESCKQTGQLGQLGLENRYQNALGQANTDAKMAQCCCETNRNIDAVRYDGAKNTCDIITSQTASTQKILDKLSCLEITNLRDKLAEKDLELSQCRQNGFITSQFERYNPRAIPSYPVWNNAPIFTPAVSSGSFCNVGNGCGVGTGCGIL